MRSVLLILGVMALLALHACDDVYPQDYVFTNTIAGKDFVKLTNSLERPTRIIQVYRWGPPTQTYGSVTCVMYGQKQTNNVYGLYMGGSTWDFKDGQILYGPDPNLPANRRPGPMQETLGYSGVITPQTVAASNGPTSYLPAVSQ